VRCDISQKEKSLATKTRRIKYKFDRRYTALRALLYQPERKLSGDKDEEDKI